MNIKIFLIFFICSINVYALDNIIAIDGVSGFVGSSLLNNMHKDNLHIGCFDCNEEFVAGQKYYKGNIYDPVYLTKFLDNANIYYQIAALSSIETDNSLEEYILTNSIGPYIASRINKSMTFITLSTIAIQDVPQNEDIDRWAKKLVVHFANLLEYNFTYITESSLTKELELFISLNPPPRLERYQYYGISKILLEMFMQESSHTRVGHTVVVRSALIIGDAICNRKENSIVKNIMNALFVNNNTYEVWDRKNYFTPIHKLKEMLIYIANNTDKFAKFETLNAGWVSIHQHDFVRLLLKITPDKNSRLRLVDYTNFQRDVAMVFDDRLLKYYPNMTDVVNSIFAMVAEYSSITE